MLPQLGEVHIVGHELGEEPKRVDRYSHVMPTMQAEAVRRSTVCSTEDGGYK